MHLFLITKPIVARTSHANLKWLESFVSNGTTQIQAVSQNVDRICQELMPLQDVGGEKAESEGPQNVGIRSEVAALASAMKAVEERDTSLKALVTETLETVKGKEAEKTAFGQYWMTLDTGGNAHGQQTWTSLCR